MTISSILSSRLVAAYVSPGQEQLPAKPARKAQGPDTVSISKQAQQLAREGDHPSQEVRGSGEEEPARDATDNTSEKG